MKIFIADAVRLNEAYVRGHGIAVDTDGRIAATGPLPELEADFEGAEVVRFDGCALLPGCVSAHSHCFQVMLRGRSPEPRDFTDWVDRLLYPLVQDLDEERLRAAALLTFSEMARAGITTVGEFHYVHNGPDGKPPDGDPNRYAEVVIDAAREVGLRIALLRTCYDTRSRAGQERFAESPEAAHRAVMDLAARMRDRDGVTVMPAPHSLHGASAEMIAAAVAAADELNTRFHIHLAEQPGDAAFSQERYGATPLRALEKLGALTARTVLIHGLYLDDEERRALAGAGGALVVNPTTNAHLGDGTTDLAAVLQAGIDLALGTDADQAPSIFEEMRAIEYAARGRECRMGVAEGASNEGTGALLRAASAGGGNALGLPVGWLAKGEYADFIALDLHHPSLLPASLTLATETSGDSLSPSPLDLAILHSLDRGAVRHVHVGGKPIVENSQVLAMPPQELAVLLQ